MSGQLQGGSPASGQRVAILALLANLGKAYSVAGVVLAQIRLLRKHGHDVVLVTTSDFESWDLLPPNVEVRLFDRYHGETPSGGHCPDFTRYVTSTAKVFAESLSDCSVCITHDVIFLRDFVFANWAMRTAAAQLPGLRWLHWMHSAPGPRPPLKELAYPFTACYCGMPRSKYIYVNRTDVPRVAQMYDVPEGNVRTVHNFVDPCDALRFHPLSRELYDRLELWSADVICVYPTRLVEAKQIDKLIKLMAAVKARNQVVRLVVCNSYSNAKKEKELIETLLELADQQGLEQGDVTFTSKISTEWIRETGYDIELGVPNDVVVDLMHVSDVFVLPSVSEACSIIMLEAAITKNVLVLNKDILSMLEFGGQAIYENAGTRSGYFSFGSLTRPITSYHPNEKTWFDDHARVLLDMQLNDRAIQFFKHVRKYHSPDWIYLNHIEPLLSQCG